MGKKESIEYGFDEDFDSEEDVLVGGSYGTTQRIKTQKKRPESDYGQKMNQGQPRSRRATWESKRGM